MAAAAVLVSGAYMVARHFVYRAMPVVEPLGRGWFEMRDDGPRIEVSEAAREKIRGRTHRVYPELPRGIALHVGGRVEAPLLFRSPELFLRRDAVMCVFRLLALAILLGVTVRAGGWRRWGWGRGLPPAGGAVLAATSADVVFDHLAYGTRPDIDAAWLAAGWLTTVPVALFEEVAFRSLLFLALRERLSPRWAAVLSSTAFTLWHYEAQPISLGIFVFGLAACAALHGGVGLAWLIFAHWLVDTLWFHLAAPPPLWWAWHAASASMWAAFFGALYLLGRPASQEAPAGGPQAVPQPL